MRKRDKYDTEAERLFEMVREEKPDDEVIREIATSLRVSAGFIGTSNVGNAIAQLDLAMTHFAMMEPSPPPIHVAGLVTDALVRLREAERVLVGWESCFVTKTGSKRSSK